MPEPRVLAATPENLARCAEELARGGIVGMPTETVYGLAGLALDEGALARIFGAKERPTFDPLIVHVEDLPAAVAAGIVEPARFTAAAGARVGALAAAFWPGPLTLVLPRGPRVPDLCTSGLPTVAVRSPRHPVARALLAAVAAPLAAPSANRFGRISPTSAADVVAELGDRVELVLDGGPCEVGLESTVVAVADDGSLVLLRPGGVPVEDVESAAGVRVLREASSPGPVAAPGMLESHYAPRKPLVLLPAAGATLRGPLPAHIGLLLFSGDAQEGARRAEAQTGRQVTVEVLTATGDVGEAARRLFAALRALDESAAQALFAEPVPSEEGLGFAIMDRLRRAAGRRA